YQKTLFESRQKPQHLLFVISAVSALIIVISSSVFGNHHQFLIITLFQYLTIVNYPMLHIIVVRPEVTLKHYSSNSVIHALRRVFMFLKEHHYPPEGMEDAVQTVMTQCELWTDRTDL
ncbi:hypothetical protein ACMZ74_04690, partial [Gardnerella pickettii]